MLKRLGSGLLALVLLVALLPSWAAATGTSQLSLTLDKSSVAVGGTATLTVSLTDGADVYGSAVDVVFDPMVLEFQSATGEGLISADLTTDKYFTSTVNATLSATAERRSVITIRLGNQAGATGNGKLADLTFKGLKEGTAVFTVDGSSVAIQLVDSQGKSVAALAPAAGVTLTVGSQSAVTPAITSPSDSSYSSSATVTFSGTAGADASLIPVVDGVDQTAISASGTSFSYDATFTTQGSHTVLMRDSAANLSSSTVHVTVDTIPPDVTVSDIPATVTTNSVTVSGTVSDANFDAVYVQVNPADSTLSGAVTVTNGAFSTSVTLTSPAGTVNAIRVTAVDKAGNLVAKTQPVTVSTNLPYLRVELSPLSAGPGSSVTANVYVENLPVDVNGVPTVYGIQFGMSYPTDLLQANSISESDNLFTGTEVPAMKSIDKGRNGASVPGIIHWSMSTSTVPLSTTKLVASITFTVRSTVTSESTAQFRFADVWSEGFSTVLYNSQGFPVPSGTSLGADLSVVVGGAVSGKVVLMGRPETRIGRSDYRGYADVKVEVVDANDKVVAFDTTKTSDGHFTVTSIPAGTYTVRFSRQGFLTFSILNVPVVAGTTTSLTHLSFSMRPGNIKDNAYSVDQVSGEDLTLFAQAWGTDPTGAKWNANADLNDDQLVNGGDLTLLAQAWGRLGSTQAGSNQVLNYTQP